MTSARRTPRYVGIIGAEPMGPHPMGPQLMGPHPAVKPAEDPQPAVVPSASPARRNSSGIIPLHREHPGRYTPDSDRAPTPPLGMPRIVPAGEPVLPAAPAAPRGPRRRVVPVDRRPWRVMIVPASPAAAPRSFNVSRWQARTVLVMLALLATLASAFVASVVVAVRSPELFGESAEAEELRAELAVVRDSLALSRAALAEGESDGSGDADSAATLVPAPIPEAAAIPVPERPHAAPERPKPFAARSHGAHESSVLSLVPRSLADLPVIGALASGFSLARRHPILHRVRPHLGVDLAAPRGTRVSAPAPGRVSFVGRKLGFGLVVELDHGQGITTRYAHLRSSAVEVGENVTKGEAIAAVGTSGITTGPHLHYEVLVHGRQVDPLRFRWAQPELPGGVVSVGAAAAAAAAPAPAPAAGGAVPAAHDGASPPAPAPPR